MAWRTSKRLILSIVIFVLAIAEHLSVVTYSGNVGRRLFLERSITTTSTVAGVGTIGFPWMAKASETVTEALDKAADFSFAAYSIIPDDSPSLNPQIRAIQVREARAILVLSQRVLCTGLEIQVVTPWLVWLVFFLDLTLSLSLVKKRKRNLSVS